MGKNQTYNYRPRCAVCGVQINLKISQIWVFIPGIIVFDSFMLSQWMWDRILS